MRILSSLNRYSVARSVKGIHHNVHDHGQQYDNMVHMMELS